MTKEGPSSFSETLLQNYHRFSKLIASSVVLTFFLNNKVNSQDLPKPDLPNPLQLIVDGVGVKGDEKGVRFETRKGIEFKIIEWVFWTTFNGQRVNIGSLLIEKPVSGLGKGSFVLTPEIMQILDKNGQCLPFISFPREKGTIKRPTDSSKIYIQTCLSKASGFQDTQGQTIFEFNIPENMSGMEIELDERGFHRIIFYVDDSIDDPKSK